MQPLGQTRSGQPEPADAARARLASALGRHGPALSVPVRQAFERVPRHIFVPEVGTAAAYRDEALVIKCGPDGLPVSSSSQPAMMAIMLSQLDLRPGHRVLEIGTGSGYNAAVMSEVVGPSGEVVSIDIDPELIGRAETALAATGYHGVKVLCADGGYGDAAGAPFDRIIVTAGAWDIAPAWLDQLADGGLLVLPLSVSGVQLSVALRQSGAAQWRATSACRCGFVRMLGAFAGPEAPFIVDRPGRLVGQVADGKAADVRAIQRALAAPAVHEPLAAELNRTTDLSDLDLWLTFSAAALTRVTLLAAPGGWFPLADLLPIGALVSEPLQGERLGIAVLVKALGRNDGLAIAGYGPGGQDLARSLSGLAEQWAERGRPGAAQLGLTVCRAEQVPHEPGQFLVAARPSVMILAGWES